jgi:hypothetical protein
MLVFCLWDLIKGHGALFTLRDPDIDTEVGRIASIEEVSRSNGSWITLRRLNVDQTNQGRQLSMAPHQVHVYRVILYATARTAQAS